jgi:hypothetical protein
MVAILPVNRQDYTQYVERVLNVNDKTKSVAAVTKASRVEAILTGAYLYNEEKQTLLFDKEKGQYIDIIA